MPFGDFRPGVPKHGSGRDESANASSATTGSRTARRLAANPNRSTAPQRDVRTLLSSAHRSAGTQEKHTNEDTVAEQTGCGTADFHEGGHWDSRGGVQGLQQR